MTLFALSCVVTTVLTAIICIVLLFNDIRNKINRVWFYTVLSILAWTIGLYGTVTVQNSYQALFWQRILYIGTICVPIFFCYFCLNLLNKINKKTKYIIWIGCLLAILFSISLFSRLFIAGIKERNNFGYWPVSLGPLYYLFLLYFTFYVVYPIILLKVEIKKHEGVYQKQIQYVYYSALIGFIGSSTNFLLDSNLDPRSFSFGNYFVIFYIVFITYATLKHHLFKIRIIATELLTLVLWIILFIKIILSINGRDLVINIGVFSAVAIVGILLVRSVIKEVEQREHIQQLYEEVDRLSKAKSEFISIASHQLRTPLTIIRGYLDLLWHGHFGEVAEKNKEPLRKIEVVTQGMISLVNDLLDISRIEAGTLKLDIKRFSLEEIIASLIEEMKIKAGEKKLTLKWEKINPLPQITADPGKIKQVVLNLVDNAIKYTEKGEVVIRTETKEPSEKYENGSILISVRDTGPGLSKEEISQLFQTYVRGETGRKKASGGLGIGLYVARKFAEAHGGRVWAESEGKDRGSTFYIELPVG